MSKKYFFLFFTISFIGIVAGVLLYKHFAKPQTVHFHAGFQVYIDGKLQNYSNQKYMSLLPCGKVYSDPSLEQLEKAHLHNQVGDVVHVHRNGATWQDLFTNMGISFANPLIGYINGKLVSDPLHQPIHPYDRAIFLVGTHGNIKEYLKNQVQISHMLQVERGSIENCGTSNY